VFLLPVSKPPVTESIPVICWFRLLAFNQRLFRFLDYIPRWKIKTSRRVMSSGRTTLKMLLLAVSVPRPGWAAALTVATLTSVSSLARERSQVIV